MSLEVPFFELLRFATSYKISSRETLSNLNASERLIFYLGLTLHWDNFVIFQLLHQLDFVVVLAHHKI